MEVRVPGSNIKEAKFIWKVKAGEGENLGVD